LAQLQKQRELKQAGIDVYRPQKIKGTDYNAEVPFEVKVPLGRHEISQEERPDIEQTKQNQLLKQMETRLRDEEEKRKRMLDKKRI